MDISGLVFDAKYNIIHITDAYELGQYLLASEKFASVPRGASTLLGVGNPLQIINPCGFQYFADQSSLTKLKSTIIQCIDINPQELKQLFYL